MSASRSFPRPVLAGRVATLRLALELVEEREALDRAPLPLAAAAIRAELLNAEARLASADRPRGLVAALEQPATERRLVRAHGELQSVRADLAADRQRAERRAWNRSAKHDAIAREAGARECHNAWFARLTDDASEPLPSLSSYPEG